MIMNMKLGLFFAALMVGLMALMSGCSSDTLSLETVESARAQANENSEFNAKSFRQTHTEYAGYSIAMRADSTQSTKCGQGDGWASIDLVNVDNGTKVPLKCSTVSAAVGCISDLDLKARSYANHDGQCDKSLPFPVPKIQK